MFAFNWSVAIVLCLLSLQLVGAEEDHHEKCGLWAGSGECEANPNYMLKNCAHSCEQDRIMMSGPPEDRHSNCEVWANGGECDANPKYMLRNCRKSCGDKVPEVPTDFYSISERDIYGNMIYFEQFRGKYVYIVNVASQCGYTADNYKLLQQLSQMRSDKFEILIFPCNQFGGQEPGDTDEISYFAQQFGYEGLVMEKGDVNGPNTGSTFTFLKRSTDKKRISWNFDGKFLVDMNGNVEALPSENVLATITARLKEGESADIINEL